MDRCASFAIQVLHEGQSDLARCFASHQRPSGAQAADVLDAVATPLGNAIVPGAIAVFECTPYARHPGGDHVMYLGRVARIHAGSDDRLPLTFHRGSYTVPVSNHLTITSPSGK
jgi:flavin reductase (DIM6/NTAB) family NADH-FMN oxidoreductase RutF